MTDGDTDDVEYGDFPLKRHLGMEMEGDQPGHGRARITIGEQHLNPNRVVHGAVIFAMVDTAMGKAAMSVLSEGQFCASVDVQLRFLRSVAEGELVADVEVLKQGRSVLHLGGHVDDHAGRRIATAEGTFAVIGA